MCKISWDFVFYKNIIKIRFRAVSKTCKKRNNYFSNDKVYAGISSTHVPSATVAEKSAAFRIARHYYLMAGYSMPLTQSIELQPSIFVKSDGAHAQMDLNAIAVYNDLFFGGHSDGWPPKHST